MASKEPEPAGPELAGRPPSLVLLRHGQTEWSLSGRHTGTTDIPLTDEGERRARAVAPLLASREFALVLVSPRQRAMRTAALAGFSDAVIEPNLVEWDYGAYEGLTSPEIDELRPGWDLWRHGTPAGATPGESAADVRRRVDAVIARALPELERGNNVLLVAHGHVLRALGAGWIQLPPEGGGRLVLATAGIAELGFEHDNRVIDRWNTEIDPAP